MPDDNPPANKPAKPRELDRYDLANASCRLLKLALRRAGELVVEETGEAGLRPRPFMTLIAIQQNPGVTQNDLVKITGSDRSTIGELIQRFVSRGFVTRKRDVNDQRVNLLSITEAGELALRVNLHGALRAEERFRAMVPAAQRETFFNILAQLAEYDEESAGDAEAKTASVS
jgi:DNA-binding MarR family transcriptional regulator